jgi:hypothetical protein
VSRRPRTGRPDTSCCQPLGESGGIVRPGWRTSPWATTGCQPLKESGGIVSASRHQVPRRPCGCQPLEESGGIVSTDIDPDIVTVFDSANPKRV